jgi:hypothetical protein
LVPESSGPIARSESRETPSWLFFLTRYPVTLADVDAAAACASAARASDPSGPAKELVLKNFNAAIAMVVATLEKQSEVDWATAYSSKGMEDAGDRFTAFLRCAAHVSHHAGQIIYLCKEIARQAEHVT